MKFDDLLTHHLGEFGLYQKVIYAFICLPPIWCAISTYSWTFTGADIPHRPSFQWELVCDRAWIKAAIQSGLYIGVGFGSLVLGYLANRFGRKPVIFYGTMLLTACNILSAWSPNWIVFAILRFLIGFFEPALWQTPYCVSVEICGPSTRMVSGQIIQMFFTVGMVLVGAEAYFIRDWQILQLVATAPSALFIAYYWILPESPRWLLSMGRRDEAFRIIKRMAKVNGVQITDELLESLNEENDEDESSKQFVKPTAKPAENGHQTETNELMANGHHHTDESQHATTNTPVQYSYLDLIRTPNMCRKTIICCFCWTMVVLIYYAISLNPAAVAGEFYLAFILGSLVEVPAVIFLLLTLNYAGRKFPQALGFSVSGAALIIIAVLPNDWDTTSLLFVNVSKFAVVAAFCIIYLHTSEIFPTVLRALALGLTVTFSRIGGIISPFANMYMDMKGGMSRTVTLLTFGVLACTAGLLTLLLPETAYRSLPETLHDGEQFGKPIRIFERIRISDETQNQPEQTKMMESGNHKTDTAM